MPARVVVSVLLVLTVVAGCDKRTSRHELAMDLDGLDTQIAARLDRLYASAGVDKNMDGFVEAVLAEPALAGAGAKLFAELGADPKLAAEAEKLLGSLGESPRMLAIVKELMAANPGQDVGTLAAEKVGKNWETPGIGKNIESSFGELISKLDVKGELGTVSRAIERRLGATFTEPTRTAAWEARLTRLNGGTAPAPRRATQLYVDTAWSDARVQKFLTAVLVNPVLRRETATFLAELLGLDTITTALKTSAIALATDPALQAAGGQLMLELLENVPDIAAITALQRKLLLSPLTVTQAQRLAHVVLSEPKVASLVGLHLDRIAADPALKTAFEELIDNW